MHTYITHKKGAERKKKKEHMTRLALKLQNIVSSSWIQNGKRLTVDIFVSYQQIQSNHLRTAHEINGYYS
jgi:hypothetical protein